MNISKEARTFKQILKRSSLTIGLFLLLKILHKLIFRFDEFKKLFHQPFASEHLLLASLALIGVILILWLLVSFIFAAIYFNYRKIKDKFKNKGNH